MELLYQGQEIPGSVTFGGVGPTTAFIKAEVVMPVGTRLVLRDGDANIALVVIRTVDEKSGTSGVYVKADGKLDKEFWQDKRTSEEDFDFSFDRDAVVEESIEASKETTKTTVMMSTDDLESVFDSGPPEDQK